MKFVEDQHSNAIGNAIQYDNKSQMDREALKDLNASNEVFFRHSELNFELNSITVKYGDSLHQSPVSSRSKYGDQHGNFNPPSSLTETVKSCTLRAAVGECILSP